MISSLVTLLLVVPALVHGQDYDEYEVDPNAIEGLPASAADLLDAPYDDGFNCDQQDAGYGYYADVNNACKVGTNWTWFGGVLIIIRKIGLFSLGICINKQTESQV